MRHVIRIDVEVDEDPVDEGGEHPYSWASLQPLREKYAQLAGEKLGATINPDRVRVFPMRIAQLGDGKVLCPNGHDRLQFFELVHSTRDVEEDLDESGAVVVSADSREHDGDPDILDFECRTCNVQFTLPLNANVEYV